MYFHVTLTLWSMGRVTIWTQQMWSHMFHKYHLRSLTLFMFFKHLCIHILDDILPGTSRHKSSTYVINRNRVNNTLKPFRVIYLLVSLVKIVRISKHSGVFSWYLEQRSLGRLTHTCISSAKVCSYLGFIDLTEMLKMQTQWCISVGLTHVIWVHSESHNFWFINYVLKWFWNYLIAKTGKTYGLRTSLLILYLFALLVCSLGELVFCIYLFVLVCLFFLIAWCWKYFC